MSNTDTSSPVGEVVKEKVIVASPYRRVETDDEEPRVAVKDPRRFFQAQEKNEEELAAQEDEQLKKTNPQEHDWKKRFGDAQRYLNQKNKTIKELEAQIEALKNQSTKNDLVPSTEEEFAEWTEKYPQVAAVIAKLVEKTAGNQIETLQAKIDELSADKTVAQIEAAKARLSAKHPDWQSYVGDAKFESWVLSKSKRIQDVIEHSDDPDELSEVLDLYKLEQGIGTKAPRKSAAEAAEAPVRSSTRGPSAERPQGKIYKESEIDRRMKELKYNPDALDAFEEEVDLANREGRIVFDVSGAR